MDKIMRSCGTWEVSINDGCGLKGRGKQWKEKPGVRLGSCPNPIRCNLGQAPGRETPSGWGNQGGLPGRGDRAECLWLYLASRRMQGFQLEQSTVNVPNHSWFSAKVCSENLRAQEALRLCLRYVSLHQWAQTCSLPVCTLHVFFVFSFLLVLFIVERAWILVSNKAVKILLKSLRASAVSSLKWVKNASLRGCCEDHNTWHWHIVTT